MKLMHAIGFACVNDFYEPSTVLGKGQFGLVKLATHKKTSK